MGNGNRFETEVECKLACVPEASADLDLCSLQVDQGACRGTYQVSLQSLFKDYSTRHVILIPHVGFPFSRDFTMTTKRVGAKSLATAAAKEI